MNTYPPGNTVVLRGVIFGSGTKLAANFAAGGSAVAVYDTTGYTNNDPIVVNPGGATEERRTVDGVPSGLTVPLSDPLLFNHATREPVGELATPGTVVCTVRLPDGTLATPAIGTAAVGVYQAEYVTVQPGRHIYRFVGSGAVAATSPEGVFNVDDVGI